MARIPPSSLTSAYRRSNAALARSCSSTGAGGDLSSASDHLDAVAADLAGRGWVTWNIEYRRLGLGGGYPLTLTDAAAAIDHLATLKGVDTERVVAVGHSAGGHLATWAAGRAKLAAGAPGAQPVIQIAGAISLAGVVDLGSAAREKLGNGAATRTHGR